MLSRYPGLIHVCASVLFEHSSTHTSVELLGLDGVILEVTESANVVTLMLF